MKIEYSILWLDDNIQNFIDDEYVSEVKEYIEEKGFEATIDTAVTYIEFFEKLNNTYDLILTDYHMNGMNGEEVVRTVRSSSYDIETEILFYTAKADLEDAKKIDRISFLETEGLGDHEELVVEKLKNLIELTIKKFENIVVMRGMIMHETSSLDEEKINILHEILKDENGIFNEACSHMNNASLGRLKHFNKQNKKLLERHESKGEGLLSLLDNPVLFSAYFQTKALGDFMDEWGGITNFSESYYKEIIKVRNQFAHSILKKEGSKEYFDHHDGEIIFDDEVCKDIRKNIRKHQRNLQSLKDTLNPS